MKKSSILSILLQSILLQILSIPLFAQNAAGDVWFIPVSSQVMIGTDFTTEVHANSVSQNLSAYGFDFTYDQAIITPNTALGNSSVEPGPDGFVSAVNPNTPGLLLITGFDAMGTGPGADLHVLTINWNAVNMGSTTLGNTVRDLTNPMGVVIGNPNGLSGNVVVGDVDYTLGDVNEDGSINIADALIIAQYYVGLNPPQFTAPTSAGDTSGDGNTNIVDAMLIAQYYVGLITVFPGATGTPVPTPVPSPDVTAIPGQETQISLNGNSISVNGDGATVNGTNVTISSWGTYTISGTLNDGRIIVDTIDELPVTLNLNGINIYSSVNSPLSILNSPGGTVIVLAENTTNYITDSSNYQFEDTQTDEPNAALFSKDDMDIAGTGSLVVDANYNDGIACKDDMNINDCTITVTSVDDGIRGKNTLEIKSGTTIIINSGGDCLKSDDAEDGLIEIKKCNLDLNSTGGDAMDAEIAVTVTHEESNVNITTTGGGTDISTKGIKGDQSVLIENGIIIVDSTDDAVHSNDIITINGGTFTVASGDDAFHSNSTFNVNGGIYNITECYEGFESENIIINDGDIHIKSSDDGINIASGDVNSGGSSGHGDPPPAGEKWCLYINGGHTVIDSNGDGVDSVGDIEMNGGTIIVNGPPRMGGTPAFQSFGTFIVRGGFMLGAGGSNVGTAPGTTGSTQNTIIMNLSTTQPVGTMVHLQTSSGSGILTFMPLKGYRCITFSSPDIAIGTTYDFYLGGSSSGTVVDGLYTNGTYSPGNLYTTFTVNGISTIINSW